MPVLSKISLRSKLLLLVLLPFLVLGYFTFDKISLEKVKIADMENIHANMVQLEKVSELTHEFQKERDFAIKFLLNPLLSAENELRTQIKLTDSVKSTYRSFVLNSGRDTSDLQMLNEFEKIRNKITGYTFGPNQVERGYNQLISYYLDLVAQVGSAINTPLIKEEMKAYLSLAESKESLGKIRNVINKALVFSLFQRYEYGIFSELNGAFKYNLNVFLRHSPDKFKSRFSMDIQAGTMINTLDIINYCFENQTNNLSEFTATDWWISATGSINLLHELELFVLSNIKGSLNQQEEYLENDIYSLYLMLSIVLISVLVLVSLIAKSITGQLKRIEFVVHNLKLGKTDVKVQITSDDEIGKLAKSFNEMARDATNMASLAEDIGKGNYETEFEKRSEEDIFGKALLNMRDNLKAKTDALNDNITQLKEASQYKTDFLANMSHELRTPLNSMLILASLLQENKEENLNDEQLEFIGIIHKSGWDLLDLINDILDLSKIEAGKLGVELMEVDLFKVLDDCYKLFSNVAFENKLEFSIVQVTPIPQIITSDEMRLSQILKNLIGNALKFTPSGGSVRLLFSYQNETLEFNVVDSGIGIEKDKQEAIFGDFNQTDGSTSRIYGGTGLGLSITLNLVELLNGELTLESEKGKGSKFSVYLPLKDVATKDLKNLPEFKKINQIDKAKVKIVVDNDSSESEHLQELSFKSKKALSILLIDSDISNVFQLSADLSSLNIEIEEASTINELKEKNMLDYPVVLVNLKSIETSDLEPILEFIEENDLDVIKIGLGNKVTDFSSITALKNEVQKFI